MSSSPAGVAADQRTALFLTAIDLEFGAVAPYLTDKTSDLIDGQYFFTLGTHMSLHRPWRIVLGTTGMGNIEAALKTTAAVNAYAPDVVFMVGIAGSLKDDVRIGDVVAARSVQYYEAAKIGGTIQSRPQIRNVPEWLVGLAGQVKCGNAWQDRLGATFEKKKRPRAFLAAIASGEKVQANVDAIEYEYLKTHFGEAHAVEMEGYGVLRAIASPEGTPGIVIRGISDRVADKSQPGEGDLQEEAAARAAAFAFEMLSEGDATGLWEKRLDTTARLARPQTLRSAIPYHGTPHFQGREREMAELERACRESRPVVAIVGMSGVGKTQLVTEYALQASGRGEDTFWLTAESSESLAAALSRIGGSDDVGADKHRAALARVAEAAEPLVVLDNAPLTQDVSELLGELRAAGARIVVTSQNQGWRAQAAVIDLDVLDRRDSVALLRSRSGRVTDEGLDELAAVLGDLPLALEQAAAYMELTAVGPDEYAAMLRRDHRVLAQHAPVGQYGRVLGAAWDAAMAEVEGESADALVILSTLSLLGPSAVPRWLLGGDPIAGPDQTLLPVMPRALVSNALAVLRRLSLVTLTADSVSLHSLLRVHVRSRLTEDGFRGATQSASLLLWRAFPEDLNDAGSWRKADLLAPHLREVLPAAEEHGVDFAITLLLRARLADWYRAQGRYEEALPVLEDALRTSQRAHGVKGIETVREILNLAVVLRGAGQSDRGIRLLREAEVILESSGSSQEQAWLTAMVKYNLGEALSGKGPDEALEGLRALKQALTAALSLRGTPLARRAQRLSVRIQSETGEGIVRLGMVGEDGPDKDLIDDGVRLLREGLAAQREVLGPESGEIAWTEARLAFALVVRSDTEEARGLGKSARERASRLDEGNAVRGHVERILREAGL